MIDPIVLLAPILLLGVIALVGFVGCEFVFPLTGPAALPPTNIHVTAGDGIVTLFWDPSPGAVLFEIDREIAPPGMPPASYTNLDSVTPAALPTVDGFLAYEDRTVVNGLTYHYVVRTTTVEGTSADSADIEATPRSPFGPFVTQFTPGTVRLGEEGWFGIAFLVTAPGVTVQKLGRFYGPANSGSHEIRIIDAATQQTLGTTSVNLASETLDGFKYGNVTPSGVPLQMNSQYFVMSHEAPGGDDFLTQDTTVTTRGEAMVTSAIDSATLVVFTPAGGANHAYGPVNFQY